MKTVIHIGLYCLLLSIGHAATLSASEYRVIGFNNNTVALATVDVSEAAVGDVYVVLDFEEDWFREVGRIRIVKLLATGAVGHVISSPKTPTEWYNKIAIPETAWDAETYQQWRNGEDGATTAPRSASAGTDRPRTQGPIRQRDGRPERRVQTPVTTRTSARSSVHNTLGWAKWVCYAAGAGSAAAALIYNQKAQDAWDDAQPGKSTEENAGHRQDARDYQKLRGIYGWGSAGLLLGGVVLHEWELISRNQQQAATAQLQSHTDMASVGLSLQMHW